MPRAVRKGGVITEFMLSPKKGGAAIGFPVSPKSEISRVSRADMSKQMGVGIVGMPITETYVGKGSFLNLRTINAFESVNTVLKRCTKRQRFKRYVNPCKYHPSDS